MDRSTIKVEMANDKIDTMPKVVERLSFSLRGARRDTTGIDRPSHGIRNEIEASERRSRKGVSMEICSFVSY